LLQKSTIQLLRFPFSIFLMPVYWFALSQCEHINKGNALLVFIILHGLVYPSSNGYNSFMDKDESSIGGIEKPMKPTRQLFYASVIMDVVAVLLSISVSYLFAAGMVTYILASRAYSYRGIRLKKYPIIGYLTVIIFQGALVFYLVMHGCSVEKTLHVSGAGMLAAGLLIGGFYPLTQIYQHEQDKADGVVTISMLVGYKGTFIFTAIVYTMSTAVLAYLLFSKMQQQAFFIIQLFLLPVLVYFFWWFSSVAKNTKAANFKNSIRMNVLASFCSNLAFITLYLIEHPWAK
jgi:1,4-dihydroxy-2-naphthoate octaprenyltransferase